MKIISSKEFEKTLDKIPLNSANKIRNKINNLATSKENLDIKKLKNRNDYRLRIGDYRVTFEYSSVENKVVIILHAVSHRKDVYKKRK